MEEREGRWGIAESEMGNGGERGDVGRCSSCSTGVIFVITAAATTTKPALPPLEKGEKEMDAKLRRWHTRTARMGLSQLTQRGRWPPS
ncbi:hypothetical protein EE612_011575 [Oryza sativa]|nr:hypothetical protein EE612_011575 [Oryza sativa]